MPLTTATAAHLSQSLVGCARILVRNKATIPQLHPAIDNSSMRTLFTINGGGAARISSLADLCHCDVSTMSRQVTSMVDSGLVQRIPDPRDGRASLVDLTDDGRELIAQVHAARTDWLGGLLSDWSDTDGERLAGLLDRLTEALEDDISTRQGGPADGAGSVTPSTLTTTDQRRPA